MPDSKNWPASPAPATPVTVSELYRLGRDLADILAVRAWCQQREVRLRVLSGALSGVTALADLLPDRLDQLGADVTTEARTVRVEIPGK